jgi:hypothetical protein
MLLRSTRTPVNAQLIFSVPPPNNSGIPGIVYVKIFPLEWRRTTGVNIVDLIFFDSIY